MSAPLVFTVVGQAQPKGSTKAFMRPGMKFPIVTSDNRSLKGWEQMVRAAIQQHAPGVFFGGPVSVFVTFDLPRPKSLGKKVAAHVKRPDLDKLVRGALDAMKGVLWTDDSQVTHIQARKQYADSQPQAHFEIHGERVVLETEETPSASSTGRF